MRKWSDPTLDLNRLKNAEMFNLSQFEPISGKKLKERNNNRRSDRYVMINPPHLKPVLKPMNGCIEYSRDPARSMV
jgi:hypothetical protein